MKKYKRKYKRSINKLASEAQQFIADAVDSIPAPNAIPSDPARDAAINSLREQLERADQLNRDLISKGSYSSYDQIREENTNLGKRLIEADTYVMKLRAEVAELLKKAAELSDTRIAIERDSDELRWKYAGAMDAFAAIGGKG